MAKNDEISSTERLLDQIRGNSDPQPVSAAPPPPKKKFSKPDLSTLFPAGKPITVGLDIGYTELKLVKMGHSSENKLGSTTKIWVSLDKVFYLPYSLNAQ